MSAAVYISLDPHAQAALNEALPGPAHQLWAWKISQPFGYLGCWSYKGWLYFCRVTTVGYDVAGNHLIWQARVSSVAMPPMLSSAAAAGGAPVRAH